MPPAKDARRLIPDPDNEPNFYAISKMYPLPGDDQEDTKPKVNFSGLESQPLQAVTSCIQPPPSAVPPVPLSSIDQVSLLAALLNQSNNQAVPQTAVLPNRQGTFLQANGNVMLSSVLGNGNQGTSSITNSLIAAISQDTLNVPNNNFVTHNNTIPGLQFGNATTLNFLEALLLRQTQLTQKHAVENPSPGRPNKIPRLFDAAPELVQGVLTPMAIPSSQPIATAGHNMMMDTVHNRRIQEVAHSLASMEMFRSEAQRLEAERRKTEELQQAATANALAAQAALLAAILSGTNACGTKPDTSAGGNPNK
jgi:hypothetical protein